MKVVYYLGFKAFNKGGSSYSSGLSSDTIEGLKKKVDKVCRSFKTTDYLNYDKLEFDDVEMRIEDNLGKLFKHRNLSNFK